MVENNTTETKGDDVERGEQAAVNVQPDPGGFFHGCVVLVEMLVYSMKGRSP